MSDNPFESIRATMSFSSRDWSANHRDAWLWGIVFGWDGDAMPEMVDKHGWNDHTVQRLKKLRQRYVEAERLDIESPAMTQPPSPSAAALEAACWFIAAVEGCAGDVALLAPMIATKIDAFAAQAVDTSDPNELAFQAGATAMRELAAYVAREACLVPPDGGSPSEEEREMCAEAARQIHAVTLPSSPIWWRRCEETMARVVSSQFGVAWHDVQETERDKWRSAICAALRTVRD